MHPKIGSNFKRSKYIFFLHSVGIFTEKDSTSSFRGELNSLPTRQNYKNCDSNHRDFHGSTNPDSILQTLYQLLIYKVWLFPPSVAKVICLNSYYLSIGYLANIYACVFYILIIFFLPISKFCIVS